MPEPLLSRGLCPLNLDQAAVEFILGR